MATAPRDCIGRTLAKLEMQAFVDGLLRRFSLRRRARSGESCCS
ncbi:cytochrome P450 [Bradyrhizobium elkanii]